MDILGGRQGGGINKTKEGIVGGNSRALWQDTINETGEERTITFPGAGGVKNRFDRTCATIISRHVDGPKQQFVFLSP